MRICSQHWLSDWFPIPLYVVLLQLLFSVFVYSHTAGFTGSAPIAIGGGSVGDLFSERDRASAMALYSLGPLIGKIFSLKNTSSNLKFSMLELTE